MNHQYIEHVYEIYAPYFRVYGPRSQVKRPFLQDHPVWFSREAFCQLLAGSLLYQCSSHQLIAQQSVIQSRWLISYDIHLYSLVEKYLDAASFTCTRYTWMKYTVNPLRDRATVVRATQNHKSLDWWCSSECNFLLLPSCFVGFIENTFLFFRLHHVD